MTADRTIAVHENTATHGDIMSFYYYVVKLTGVLPLFGRGSSGSAAWRVYSTVLWICMLLSGVYVSFHYYKLSENVPSKHRMIMKVIFMEIFSKLSVSVASTAISVARSRRLFEPLDRLRRFDASALRLTCPRDTRTRAFYLLYVCVTVVHDTVSNCFYTDLAAYVLIAWNVFCVSTMLAVVQYVTCVKALGDRYELANRIFSNSMAGHSKAGTKYMHPKDVNSLFIELRGLTEEIKTYYAYHAMLIVVESILVFVSGVTTLTINRLQLDAKFLHSEYFVVHCAMRLLFLFFVVRETHGAAYEAKKTVLIGHEALSMTSDPTAAQHLEVIVLNCWNHPIKFDVLDFFDLDYKLLQSIIAAVVTYVVVLVQIQLAIIDMSPG